MKQQEVDGVVPPIAFAMSPSVGLDAMRNSNATVPHGTIVECDGKFDTVDVDS